MRIFTRIPLVWRKAGAATARPLTRRLPRGGVKESPACVTNRYRQQRCSKARDYLTTFVGGRKFCITHSSLLDSSVRLNAKRLLSG